MIKRFSTYINESNDNQEDEPVIVHQNSKGNKFEKDDIEMREDNKIQNTPKPKKFKYCNICNQKIFSIEGYNNHIQSKKHVKRIKRVTYDEIHAAGSVKNYLMNKKMINGLKRSPVSKARYELYTHLLKKIYKKLPSK